MQNPLLLESNDLLRLLKGGSPIAFPTDTVPALAASPDHAFHLWDIKNRQKTKPLILMAASSNELFEYVIEVEDPDSDMFIFEIQGEPEGMSLNEFGVILI